MLEPITLDTGLVYHRGGASGTPVVLVNALGQDLRPWARLVDRLLPRRILTWDLRCRLMCTTFADQVTDLAAVLDGEAARSCHLVGWCTGPKTALSYACRHPDRVRSIVALNPSFKHPGRPAELDTPYERNLEVLCRAVSAHPQSAERLRQWFQPDAHPGAPDTGVRTTFGSAPALVAYARQHLEFWAQPPTPAAVPTLFVSGARDEIINPAAIHHAAKDFPLAVHAELAEAGHDALDRQADRVAGLIDGFTLAAEL
jgi:pimeloyl-ACP methyl ester carboxylesterase